ncbi:MAG TPA: hypothetical protein VGF46_09505 [Gaiellales bacterium]|jgi:hypothetical protein
MTVELREVDIALASYPEDEWVLLSAPVLLGQLRDRVGIDADEAYGAVRRASYLAAAAGDPESGDDPDGPAVLAIADELHTRDRALALHDAVRSEFARATAARLPRVELVLRALVAPPGEDPQRTWRLFCAALYAVALGDEDDEQAEGAR